MFVICKLALYLFVVRILHTVRHRYYYRLEGYNLVIPLLLNDTGIGEYHLYFSPQTVLSSENTIKKFTVLKIKYVIMLLKKLFFYHKCK